MSGASIGVQDFVMRFGDRNVVDGLSFDVAPGETFGLLGSNGSGKTTTIRALLGITTPTSGTLTIDGRPYRPATGGIGYLPEERGLYRKESVIDVMTYFGRLRGLRGAEATAWSMDYLARVGLADRAKLRVDKLSGGQQQKVQLGITIMDRPRLLILDEPTKGLDPVNRRLLLDLVDERKTDGATVVLVTHHMDEVERLCDRILLLKDGRAAAYGSVPDVQDAFGGAVARVGLDGPVPRSQLYRLARHEGHVAYLVPTQAAAPDGADILAGLIAAGVHVTAFEMRRIPLDEIFVQVYGHDALAAASADGAAA
ncbi:ABC transporter ATP-binding protein [Curtobacterium aurantiacum]|uniref:ATP-binding cassette domain-containing protein n=1 Tax=Curtobacterium aurantiacum TaxID=3236919 RepID=A0ABS5VEK5_9MICO|nr:ATP-binding cassette domain-containing protein [Curtobacterium flaccumfaciens]MBT1544437.1 ATP-binding cassette domain-containing protein [Curtobacterium flaccumfaciens pv. flaccumfaciens]MBT1587265.1 ATP-binding cassette domain-containing protein [Curtobacterium flaccumfaciens pv. flaccumfaciens]MBT1674915.1 ATP-binding cassette domain-containing protein [Curtobacterium flaccumfaciens pv. flaccumfaciens]MBT1680727.1 ATP-binding cassette domain-containing protein [Curtobacterium flaccumfacie